MINVNNQLKPHRAVQATRARWAGVRGKGVARQELFKNTSAPGQGLGGSLDVQQTEASSDNDHDPEARRAEALQRAIAEARWIGPPPSPRTRLRMLLAATVLFAGLTTERLLDHAHGSSAVLDWLAAPLLALGWMAALFRWRKARREGKSDVPR